MRYLLRNRTAFFIAMSILFIIILYPELLRAQDDFNSLIRNVQRNSQQSYDAIESVSFKGHSKTYVYFGYSPLEVDLIPFLNDYYFEGFWMKPDSLRMVIKAMRVVGEDSTGKTIQDEMPLPNPFRFIYDPSLLGINSEEEDNEMVLWPLHPFAMGGDSIYNYHLESEIGFGMNKIFIVQVTPKESDMPAVVGTFMVDAYRHEVVGSDIFFNEATSVFEQAAQKEGRLFRHLVTGTNNHRVKTEKDLFYSSYWLPATMEEEFDIGLWGLDVKIHRFIEFDSYIVNPEQPDSSLLTDQKIVYDPDPEMEKLVFEELPYPDRLTREEEQQIVNKIKDRFVSTELYEELMGSEAIAEEAAKMALNQRFGRHFRFTRALGDFIVYNRVEGLRLHHGFVVSNWLLRNTTFSLKGGYGFSDRRWKGEGAALYYLTRKKKVFFEGTLYNTMGYEENRRRIPTGRNTFTSLLYKGDYRDYYYKKGGTFGIGYRLTDQLALKLAFVSQDEEIATNNTKFSIFRYKRPFRSNPEIVEGRFRGLRGSLLYRSHDLDGDVLFEHTGSSPFGSDFSYRFVRANLRRRWRITYDSDLRFHLSGGYSWGALSPQRWFDFGGKTFMNYHGNLRGVDYKTFTGDRMVQGTLEYAIKGSIFRDLGRHIIWVKALKFTFWGGLGWSRLSETSRQLVMGMDVPAVTTDGIYHEFGLGIGDVLNIFRIDFIRNSLLRNEVLVHFNMLQ